MTQTTTADDIAPLELSAVHHVALTVADLDTSAAWYTQVLGMREVRREQREGRRAAIMRFPSGGYSVALVQHTPTQTGRFDPTRAGLDHLAFTVNSRHELDRWVDRLAAAKVIHSGPTSIPTGAVANFKDPDGTALSLFWDHD